MDLFHAINTRKTIRKYKESHPPVEDIKRIIDAARLAPSATNTQNWEFIAVCNDEIKQKMYKVLIEKLDEMNSWPESAEYKNKLAFSKTYSEFFVNAPVVIVAVEQRKAVPLNDLFKERGVSEEEFYQLRPNSSLLSMGGAIENMSLAAHGLGYGTCWMCAPLLANKEYKKILNIPDEDRIVTLLTVGIPESDDVSQPPKKTLQEIMRIIE